MNAIMENEKVIEVIACALYGAHVAKRLANDEPPMPFWEDLPIDVKAEWYRQTDFYLTIGSKNSFLNHYGALYSDMAENIKRILNGNNARRAPRIVPTKNEREEHFTVRVHG